MLPILTHNTTSTCLYIVILLNKKKDSIAFVYGGYINYQYKLDEKVMQNFLPLSFNDNSSVRMQAHIHTYTSIKTSLHFYMHTSKKDNNNFTLFWTTSNKPLSKSSLYTVNNLPIIDMKVCESAYTQAHRPSRGRKMHIVYTNVCKYHIDKYTALFNTSVVVHCHLCNTGNHYNVLKQIACMHIKVQHVLFTFHIHIHAYSALYLLFLK